MKIALVGCGALGSFYGAKLCRAGETVHFLLRSDYEVVRHQGVQIESVDGDFHVQPRCARTPEEIGRCDLVLVSLKTTANDQLPRLVTPLAGPDTAVVLMQNGLGNEAQLAASLGPERLFGGLCFVCLNRVAPGRIRHSAYGLVVLGEFQRPPGPRVQALSQLFQRAAIPCQITANLEQARWEKLIWNIPFNGLGVAGAAGYDAVMRGALRPNQPVGPCVTTDILVGEPRWESLVRELMHEVIAAARGGGFPVPAELADRNFERTRTMAAYKASTLVDFENGQPLELDRLFLEPLRQARQAGVATPRLAALCAVLEQLEARHGSGCELTKPPPVEPGAHSSRSA
jgi:2-dehydropantoate 2-reductase